MKLKKEGAVRTLGILGISMFASFCTSTSAYSSEVVVDNRLTELEVVGETDLAGAGGVVLSTLSIPADGRLVLDPIATPVKVEATPTFAAGAKVALSSDYAGVTLGRVVLMTYSGTATIPDGLFDSTSVADSATLSQEVAPDGTRRQLVLTVGDYADDAKEIRILPIGDSITHGYTKNLPGTAASQQAQYRTAIAARLAANGYRPVMLGHLSQDANGVATTCDAAGVRQPDEWVSHSGSSGDSIVIHANGAHGGVRDNVHVYLDVAGEPDVVTLLIGTNDLKLNETAGDTFVAYTNLVFDIARQRPNTKIVGSTLLERRAKDASEAAVEAKVEAFNELLLANLGNLPANYACTNLFLVTSQSIPDVLFDEVHPTAKGFAPVAKGFAAKIMDTLPLATYAGPIDAALTDEPQTALGAAATVPAAYRNGMAHVFTLDSTDAAANLAGAAPYTATNSVMPLTQRLKRAGYYMELVRRGTSRRRYVWVDFDAAGRTLGEIDFPWDGDNVSLVVDNVHVFSNVGGVHNVAAGRSGVRGAIEGTRFNYSGADNSGSGAPSDIPANARGWNDTLADSGNYGCFQAHRIFSQEGDDVHWNDAEVLFAWNRWGGTSGNNEIGIGSFFLSGAFSGSRSMDYTLSSATTKGTAENIDARAYQVRHLEIWAEPETEFSHDIVIYGSSPAAISAAVQAKRMGRSAVVVSPETRIGGLTTGGLGQTDIGRKSAFGGIALEFYRDVAAWYADPAHWTRQTQDQYHPDGQTAGTMGAESMWTFEPSVALAILEGWEARDALDIRRNEWLDREGGVEKSGGRIVAITTLSGNVYRGKVFVDATYEGDLMAAAGVSYFVGREANSVYGETLNGVQKAQARHHQLKGGVDPYVVEGDPESGLLPGVEPYDPNEADGDGDSRVQAYCFRMCLTDDEDNRIPFKQPANYNELAYELLFRNYENGETEVPWINSKMPNRKTDTNNSRGFSTDFIGRNYEWAEASYARRAEICAEHLAYQQGLMWTLANHPRVPEKVRNAVSKWGTCKDEFLDGPGDGWQSQLYVREARRMVGDYVMTEANCRGTAKAPHPVAVDAYTMDSHHVRRYVGADGFVHNEGDVEVSSPPYPIDYGAICPKRGECENLLVPVCLSASHIAFGSIRMEPVFFALGQVAGTAASMAVGNGTQAATAVQDVPHASLAARLVADGQVICMVAFETGNGDEGVYTFGSPVGGGEIECANIGGEEAGNSKRFVMRSGTVNVRDGGYVRIAGYDADAKVDGSLVGANGNAATLNIDGGVFWAYVGDADLSVYSGAGRLRLGVNNGSGALARLQMSSGELKVENVLMCGGSVYNGLKAANSRAEMAMSGGTAHIGSFWLGAAESGSYSTASLDLTGGEMRVGQFVFQPYHNQVFNWGGGRIVATAANVFVENESAGGCTRSVEVTGEPAVFDTGGFAQSLPSCISGGPGTLRLVGGNVVTLAGSYTGAVSVAAGTTLRLSAQSALSGPVAVTDPEAPFSNGSYTVLELSGDGETFGGDVLSSGLVVNESHGRLELSPDGKAIRCIYGEAGWLDERAAAGGQTGRWSSPVEYDAEGKACLSGEVAFTPYTASTGNVVTVESTAVFHAKEDGTPDASAQAAVRLSTNGCFQVWGKKGNGEPGTGNGWIDVEAEGVMPVGGEEYTLRTTFDYNEGTYSVEVKSGLTEFARFVEKENPVGPVQASFPLAVSTNCVTSVAFVGDTLFTSLYGECRFEAVGFQPGEVTVADATIVLDAAKAAWLNARGEYAAVSDRLANVTSNEFASAWLCNLDIMNEDASATLKITRIEVLGESVAVDVAIERVGAAGQAINGTLKFYGAKALAAFRDGTAEQVATKALDGGDFSEGNTATATFEKGDADFYRATIE